jgi:ribose transport system substrate-binding protein
MKLMAAYLEGNKSGIPKDGIIIVPGKVIDKSNVDAFTAGLKQMMGK